MFAGKGFRLGFPVGGLQTALSKWHFCPDGTIRSEPAERVGEVIGGRRSGPLKWGNVLSGQRGGWGVGGSEGRA